MSIIDKLIFMKKDPAQTIIEFMGGAQTVAAIVGKHPTRVYKWAISCDRPEGQGGIIPARDQVKLLNYCREHNIDLRPEDFFSSERLKALLPCKRNRRTQHE